VVLDVYRRFRTAYLLPGVTSSDRDRESGEKVDATDGEAWSMFTLTTRGDALVGQAGGSTLADPAFYRPCSLGLHFHTKVVKIETILLEVYTVSCNAGMYTSP
jgi:hypothetical protein